MIATALCLLLLHTLIGILAWCSAPYPPVAFAVAILWLALAVLAARTLVARLGGWWRPALCLFLALFPVIVGGIWDLLYFVGSSPRNEVACSLVELWATPVLPLFTYVPGWWWHGTAAYLWLLNALPTVLFVALTAAAWTRSRRIRTV